jgi:Zn-dependent metalloprotease
VINRPLTRCAIVPPYVLENIARRGTGDQQARAMRALGVDRVHRGARSETMPAPVPAEGLNRTVSSADGTETLPGRPVRSEGDSPSGDPATDEAYDGVGETYDLYLEVYGRHSVDDAGLPLPATVHYGQDYDNAFWNGERMVFGDGDGELFNRFTVAVDVIGHELTHAVTQLTAGLAYEGQSGALNESVSDVFGSLVQQRAMDQDAASADWLIGAGLFTDQVQGVALRSMRAPGTAYDDDVLGRDPQPAHMRDYADTTDDNGGVHINSGIPNHAFYLAATALGGAAWARAGRIWYRTLIDGGLRPDVDFAAFAAATTGCAAEVGAAEEQAVRTAWAAVGVTG